MFFTPVITLLASPLPQHDDGRTDLTFLLQLHLPLLLSHIFVFHNPLKLSKPELPVLPSPLRSRLQGQTRRNPFTLSKTPLSPRLQRSPKSIPRDSARRKSPRIRSVLRLC
jgi:hypothetical protein